MMFHVTQRGKAHAKDKELPPVEWSVWAHAKTLPRAVDLFLVERDNALKKGWLPCEAPRVAVHCDTAPSAEELRILNTYIITQ